MAKLKGLSSLFRSAAKRTPTTTKSSEIPAAGDAPLKHYTVSLDGSSSAISNFSGKRTLKFPKPMSEPMNTPHSLTFHSIFPNLKYEDSASEDPPKQLLQDISSTLRDDAPINSPHSQKTSNELHIEDALDATWFSSLALDSISQRRKEITRTRKQKWIFKSTQGNRFNRLVGMCGQKLGSGSAFSIFERLGRDTGLKEYTALIKLCVDEARATDDEEVIWSQFTRALSLLEAMKEQGFGLKEETYGPLLMYLIDYGNRDAFDLFCEEIKDDNPSSHARLGYYEMLFYIRANDEEKIQELCSYISNNKVDTAISLQENYLLALCERDRQNELLPLLETVDITKVSSLRHVISIFKSLGRLLLESLAKKFILTLKENGYCTKNISILILSYAISIPNLAVEDVIFKFKSWHSVLDVAPSSESYEKLIIHCCKLHKVLVALGTAKEMCEEGLTLSTDTLNSMLRAIEERFDFNLVKQIYSLIGRHNLKTNNETYRAMITLRVKMKDFAGAYDMLDEIKNFNLKPSATMYNAIMGGYFRQKNIKDGLMVLKQMEHVNVKPDAQTYTILIANNCKSEDQIIKYYEELKVAGIPVTKQILMALINAYASCGLFDKAKQVILDEGIPICNHHNEIKSALVSALASHGKVSDAFIVYEEIKKAGAAVEPKAVISLIEHFQSEGEPTRIIKLLEEIQDPEYWKDGCMRIIAWCIRYKHLSSNVNLIKQLKDRFGSVELFLQVFDEAFSIIAETEPTDLQIGLDILQIIKDELYLLPSRKSLDFLLIACARAKDLQSALLIWKEYQVANYPYNVTSYLRMYQALLAAGDHDYAKKMLVQIPKDDYHAGMIVRACRRTYKLDSSKRKKKKNTK